MRNLITVFILVLALSAASNAQDTTTAIPFRLTAYNNIAIQALVNQQDSVWLMFHTATDAIALTEDATRKMKSLVFERTDSVGSWGGNGNTSRFSKHNTLRIGKLTWLQQPIWEDRYSGKETDGKFGPELFDGKWIELDFDHSQLVLHTALPEKTKDYQKLRLTIQQGMLFVEGTLTIGEDTFTTKFLLHSGYSGDLLLDDELAARHKLGEKLTVTGIQEMKDAFGNVLKNKKAILPQWTIGNEKLAMVPVAFFEGAIGRQKMSVLGGDILKRFNIIIDAKREYIYLKANGLAGKPFSAV